MRDINRIDGILKELGEIWKEYPDLRLGQLILNAIKDPQLYYIEDGDLIYYIEDEDLILKLKEIYTPTPEIMQLRGFFTSEGDKSIFNYKGFKIEVVADFKTNKMYFTFNNKKYEEPLGKFELYPSDILKNIIDNYLENNNN